MLTHLPFLALNLPEAPLRKLSMNPPLKAPPPLPIISLDGGRGSWSSSSTGNDAIPSGGCTVFCLLKLPREPFTRVFLLLRPSHSTCSSSPIGSIWSFSLSSCILFASATSFFCLDCENLRNIAAVPRIASAFGSDSGSSCSATVRT